MLRHRLSVLLIFGVLFPACQKKSPHNTSQSQNILGTWELCQTSGGMSPGVNSYSRGNGHLLQFGSASYNLYAGGQLQKRGVYTILPDTTAVTSVCLVLPAGQYGNRVIYDNNDSATKHFFQIADNTLTFLAGCYALDVGEKIVYVRVAY